MITRVEISNFQSLRRVSLDFGPWVSIVGESDVGKSAVWRALHAALTNRTGDSYIRHGEKMAEVTIYLDGGTSIRWTKERGKKRGKSGRYEIERIEHGAADGGVDHHVFEKTNGEVPAEVRALLNVSLDVAGDALTPGLQSQHDKAFLLADTPRRRAQILGEFDGSNIALAAETVLRTGQRTAQAALKAAETQAEASRATLTAYDALPAAHEAYEAAVAATGARDGLAARVARLRGLLQGGRLAQVRAEGYRGQATALTLPDTMPTPDDLQRLCERVQRGRQLIAKARFMGAAAHADRQRAATIEAALRTLPEADLEADLRRLEALRVAVAGVRYHQRRAEAARAVLAGPEPPTVEEVDALLTHGQRLARLRGLVAQAMASQAQAEVNRAAASHAATAEAEARADLAALAGEVCGECGQPLTVEVLA